jgi:hypothetical protein
VRPLLALIAVLLSGCAFTFIPLNPNPIRLEPKLTIGSESSLERQTAEIVLKLALHRVPQQGYISVFLYRDDDKVAEDSQLARTDTTDLEFRFSEATVGRYRAVVFWKESIVRQFDLEVK